MTIVEKEAVYGRTKEIPVAQRENLTLDLIVDIETAVEELTSLDGRTTKRFIKDGREIGFSRLFEHLDGNILYTGAIELTMASLRQPGAEPELGETIKLDFRHPLDNFDQVKKVDEIISFLTS